MLGRLRGAERRNGAARGGLPLWVVVLMIIGWGGAAAKSGDMWDFGVAAQRVEDLQRVSDYFEGLAREPLPDGATARERSQAFQLAQWLRNSARKMRHLARGWQVLLSRVPKRKGVEDQALIEHLQEMNRSFSVQYLELLKTMRRELGRYSWRSEMLQERLQRTGYLLDTLQ
ncbi:MAG: hypothetical protein Kow006_17820 [Gammaproteobacteria bacterium]